jgi:hypothetical protein
VTLRVVVLDRDRDVRERLVVAEPDVERGPVPLDEVLLEVERLDLAPGHDHLQVGDPGHHPRHGRALIAASGLEIRADAGPQRPGLADVEHLPAVVPEQVDAGLRGQSLELVLEAPGHAGQRIRGEIVRRIEYLFLLVDEGIVRTRGSAHAGPVRNSRGRPAAYACR